MSIRIPLGHIACMLAAILLISTSVGAQFDRDDPTIIRAEVLKLDPAMVRGWAGARCGAEIAITWFDYRNRAATVERTETAGRFVNVFGRFDGRDPGSFVLTFGNDTLVGAVSLDSGTYRLRSLGGEAYSLVQFDTGRLMPDHRDTDNPQLPPSRPLKRKKVDVGLLSVGELTRILTTQAHQQSEFAYSDKVIDILVGYSHEAASWATANGVADIDTEIYSMVADTNAAFAASEVSVSLRVVATQEVKHSVADSARLEGDHDKLKDGVGALGELHALRDKHGADLVTLLVLNGNQGDCGVDSGRACGYAWTPRKFPAPGELPGSSGWNAKFENMAFSVVHLPAAFNSHSFKHETGHKLGAHHDFYSFYQDGYDPTADIFARGWILYGQGARTIMAYNRLCTDAGEDCPILTVPRYSNPNLVEHGERLGNPALNDPWPVGAIYLGQANNALAMNRMAWAVSNFRAAP